ncbi:MAG: hypothetical protein HYS25_00955 [Ignavibacteriales bacterium]|nr:hypothetical protein [Ignavibacteriales bacterium]
MRDPAVREKAKELFVENGFSMDTILTLLDGEVSRKTLYNWREQDGWGELRISRAQRQQNRRQRLEALLDKLMDEAETATNPRLIFSIGKIIAALKSISTFEFTEEKQEKETTIKKGFTKDNLELLEKELGVL